MSLIKKNIVANFGGRSWQAVMSLAFVPLYIKFMGIESYGLVGIFASLQALFTLLDMGLSTTLNREMARLSLHPDNAEEMRDIVRTLEVIYWGVAVAIGITVVGLSAPVAHYWVKADTLSSSTIQQALMITGGVLAFQWPVSLYTGGLMGLQKQVQLNAIESAVATFRGIGAVMVLWLISPTIQAFFTWQIFISFLRTAVISFFLWRGIPASGHKPRFKKHLLVKIWRFAAGMTGISVTSILLTQTDKIVLSKLLPLDVFGYYTLAIVAANTLSYFIGPVFSALFPRFSQLVSKHDQTGLKELYHKGCQVMSVVILPAAVVVSFFSPELLLLWTDDPVIVKNTHVLLSILIIGRALAGLSNLPVALQFSYGWTHLVLYTNIITTILFVPTILLFCNKFGVVGAASAWVLLNLVRVFITVEIMHKRVLKGEKLQWYVNDVGMPLLVAVTVVLLWRLVIPVDVSKSVLFIVLLGVSTTALIATASVAPYTRRWVACQIVRIGRVSYGRKQG